MFHVKQKNLQTFINKAAWYRTAISQKTTTAKTMFHVKHIRINKPVDNLVNISSNKLWVSPTLLLLDTTEQLLKEASPSI